MKSIKNVFAIQDKRKRYHKLIDWIFSEIFNKKISILESNEFSEKRILRKNNTKFIARLIFSKDPESSAFIGPAITFRIFENQKDMKWYIDIVSRSFRAKNVSMYPQVDFVEFINEARSRVLRDFIHKDPN